MPINQTLKNMTAGVAISLLCVTSATAVEVDQRDPNYQRAIEHMASASHALNVAMEELRNADAVYNLHGINIIEYLGQLQPVKKDIDMLLFPEKKRLKEQVLAPDSVFFTPIKLN